MKQHKATFVENTSSVYLQGLHDLSPYGYASTLSLAYCGWEKCTPGYRFGPFIRKYFVLHLILRGKGRYQTEHGSYALKEDDAFLIFPGEETWYQADMDDPWEYSWVGFHGIRAEEFVKNMGFTVGNPMVHLRQMDKMAGCIQNMLAAKQINLENEVRRSGELMLLFSLLMEDYSAHQTKAEELNKLEYTSDIYVSSAMEYMILHMKEKIKLDDLADKIGITRSYLTGTFKKKMGISPQEYLIQMRMEKACILLKQSSEPIGKIAQECGYEDALTFSKAFRQKYKMSPTAYRDAEIEPEI